MRRESASDALQLVDRLQAWAVLQLQQSFATAGKPWWAGLHRPPLRCLTCTWTLSTDSRAADTRDTAGDDGKSFASSPYIKQQ